MSAPIDDCCGQPEQCTHFTPPPGEPEPAKPAFTPARWPNAATATAAANLSAALTGVRTTHVGISEYGTELIQKGVTTAIHLIREAIKAETEAASVNPLRRAALLDMATNLRDRAITEMQVRAQVAEDLEAAA